MVGFCFVSVHFLFFIFWLSSRTHGLLDIQCVSLNYNHFWKRAPTGIPSHKSVLVWVGSQWDFVTNWTKRQKLPQQFISSLLNTRPPRISMKGSTNEWFSHVSRLNYVKLTFWRLKKIKYWHFNIVKLNSKIKDDPSSYRLFPKLLRWQWRGVQTFHLTPWKQNVSKEIL